MNRIHRMPWHDVGMHVVGQPARDLARHFTERLNYLLRIEVRYPHPPAVNDSGLITVNLQNHSRQMLCFFTSA